MRKFQYDSKGKLIPKYTYYNNGKIKSKIFQHSNDPQYIYKIEYFPNGKESKTTYYYNGVISYVFKSHKIYEHNSTQLYYDENGTIIGRLEFVSNKKHLYHTSYTYKNGLLHGVFVKQSDRNYPREYYFEGVEIKNDKILKNTMDLIYELDIRIHLLEKYNDDLDSRSHIKVLKQTHKMLEIQLEKYVKTVKKTFDTIDVEGFERW